MTILSRKRFLDRLPTLLTGAKADYIALCLSMHLIQEKPSGYAQGMQTPLYVLLKNIMSMFTAAGVSSLDVVQCWVLIVFYELGHAIYPACSMSLAACAKLARWIGLHREQEILADSEIATVQSEERKRVWWAVLNLDRCVVSSSFCVVDRGAMPEDCSFRPFRCTQPGTLNG